ncbi:MAG: hypothetical protein A2X31_07555 [Elusimicrobia bacterium GWB2_63_22]|nr:MAG: hypothetical protein A2X31_07555 [Elusimicrobia bacterium GWB2_63_22]
MGDHKADKLLNFSLLLFAASCILSITAAEGALVLMLGAILWKAFTSPEGFAQPLRELHANPLVFPLALYIIAYIFSSIFSLDPEHSFSRLDTEIIKALSAVLVFSAVTRSGREKAGIWFLVGASAAALIGIGQFMYGIFKGVPGSLTRASGTMHAVSHAEIMAVAMVLAGVLIGAAKGRLRHFYIASFFILSLGFAASLSRGPALGLCFAMAIAFFLQRNARKFIIAGLAIIVLVFGASALLNKAGRERIATVTGGDKIDYTANVRLTMWKAGMDILRDYPLTGTGPYSLRRVFNSYHNRPVDGVIDFPDLHNLYIQRAADSGLPGLLALMLLLWTILKRAASSFFKYRDPYSLWGVAAFLGFLVMMLTDSSFDLPRTAFCIYLMAAMSGPAEDSRSA